MNNRYLILVALFFGAPFISCAMNTAHAAIAYQECQVCVEQRPDVHSRCPNKDCTAVMCGDCFGKLFEMTTDLTTEVDGVVLREEMRNKRSGKCPFCQTTLTRERKLQSAPARVMPVELPAPAADNDADLEAAIRASLAAEEGPDQDPELQEAIALSMSLEPEVGHRAAPVPAPARGEFALNSGTWLHQLDRGNEAQLEYIDKLNLHDAVVAWLENAEQMPRVKGMILKRLIGRMTQLLNAGNQHAMKLWPAVTLLLEEGRAYYADLVTDTEAFISAALQAGIDVDDVSSCATKLLVSTD